MRRPAPRPMRPALDELVGRLAPPTLAAAVTRVWPRAVGEAVSAQSQPGAVRGGVLTVHCRSAQWAQEIDLMSPVLLARLAELLGGSALTRLRCVATPPREGWAD